MRSLLLVLLLGTLLPVLLVRAGMYFRWLHSQYEKEIQSNLEMARAAGMAFNGYINDIARQEAAVGSALVSLEPPGTQKATDFLVRSAAEYTSVRGLHWVDLQGTVINSSNPKYLGLNVQDRWHFQQALATNHWVVSDLLQSRLDGVPVVAVALAIHDDLGHPRGVMIAAIDPDHLEHEILSVGRSPDSMVSIIDRQGRLVSGDPDLKLSWDQRAVHEDGLLAKALAGEPATGIAWSGILKHRCAIASVPIGQLGFVASASRSVDSILAPLRDDIIATGLVSLATLIGAIALAILISRRINRGLRGLQEHAEAVARGDLDHRAAVTGIAELENLADAFNCTAEQRKKVEAALRDSEARLAALIESLPFDVWTCDKTGRYTLINSTCRRRWGDLRGMMPEDAGIPPDTLALWKSNNGRALAGEEVRGEAEYVIDGKPLTFFNILAPIRDGSEIRGLVGVNVDITDRKRAEQQLKDLNETLEQRIVERTAVAEHRAAQLRAMAAELTRTEERERRRLAQMLHDDLQQLLAATKFHAGVLQNRLQSDALRDRLRLMVDLLDQSIKASRTLTTELSPPILYDGGLAPAMTWLGRWMQTRHGLHVSVKADEKVDPLAEQIRVFLFQAVRELLFNVFKHAGVERAGVEVERREEQIRIVVSDDGIGFNAADTGPVATPGAAGQDGASGIDGAGGFGLFSIRERIEWLGGSMEVDSSPGSGTRVTLWAPVTATADKVTG